MIDVKAVIGGSLWVLGLAIILATLSWADWEAKSSRIRFREVLSRSHIQRAIDFGLALFCSGLAVASSRLWERVIWCLLAATWLLLLARDFRRR